MDAKAAAVEARAELAELIEPYGLTKPQQDEAIDTILATYETAIRRDIAEEVGELEGARISNSAVMELSPPSPMKEVVVRQAVLDLLTHSKEASDE